MFPGAFRAPLQAPLASVGGTRTLILDQFTDTTGVALESHTIAPTNTPATVWSRIDGHFDIQANQANGDLGPIVVYGVYVTDPGTADVTIQCDITPIAAPGRQCVTGRLTDANNNWRIGVRGDGSNSFEILERNAGVQTVRATVTVTITPGVTYTLKAIFSGSTITATINGGNQISYNSATLNQTVTKFGIDTGTGVTGTRYDNFKVTSP